MWNIIHYVYAPRELGKMARLYNSQLMVFYLPNLLLFRVDWEMSVLRGSSVLQSLENQRLSHMKDYIAAYLKLSTDMNPVLNRIMDRLTPIITTCNVQKDIAVIKNIRRASEGPSEQLLPDFYCEHTTLAMNRERRKQALVKLLQLVRQDLERERKSRNGLRGISQQLNNADTQNVTDKLYHVSTCTCSKRVLACSFEPDVIFWSLFPDPLNVNVFGGNTI